MSRLLAYVVARNEADRYLDACLAWASPIFDGIAFYDDRSDDATVQVANRYPVKCCVRSDDVPSFLEHEGRFRQGAWEWFQDVLDPQEGDWVLALDADEFLVAAGSSVRAVLEDQVAQAKSQGAVSLRVPVPEVFQVEHDDGFLFDAQVRMDGFWGRIIGTRLFAWKPGGVFSAKAMGSGAEPSYVGKSKIADSSNLYLMHYGYAWSDDRELKYRRYSALMDHGHNNTHVESILKPPTLRRFSEANEPTVWRGLKEKIAL